MDGIHITYLSVKGVKSLDKEVELSFYKKTYASAINFQNYNIKGVYGTNGSGKTAIVSAVKILKELLLNPYYLSGELTTHKLRELVNKKTKEISFIVEFLVEVKDEPTLLYRYGLSVAESELNAYNILTEKLEYRNAKSRNGVFSTLFEIRKGEITCLESSFERIGNTITKVTTNLLNSSTLSSLFYSKIPSEIDSANDEEAFEDKLFFGCVALVLFGSDLFVYIEERDRHDDYIINDLMINTSRMNHFKAYIKRTNQFDSQNDFSIVAGRNLVKNQEYELFEQRVKQLEKFIKIFKGELEYIEPFSTPANENNMCRLIMHYDGYAVDSEFESTGVKKLIELYGFFYKMCSGSIVFIDELDANLHDVYLCALLEYLSEYSKGQLCFTSHNIGPMRILKGKKKSIDFLSIDKSIYSWTTSGNYSPATLYHNGMIKGSPFNVDLTDFIGVFDCEDR